MPTITGYHHISLTVADLERSERFYSELFGFTRVLELPDHDGHGQKLVVLHPPTFTILGFTRHASHGGAPFSEFHTGLDHVSFGVANRGELDAWIARLDELGIEHSEPVSTVSGDLVSFRDPDNIAVELWANP